MIQAIQNLSLNNKIFLASLVLGAAGYLEYLLWKNYQESQKPLVVKAEGYVLEADNNE